MKKVVGVVRNTDELGRIVIPMEMRRSLGIKAKEPMEMVLHEDGIFLRKREGEKTVREQLDRLKDMLLGEDSPVNSQTAKELKKKLDEIGRASCRERV